MTKPAHRGSPIEQLKIIIDTRIPPGRELLVFHCVGMPKCAAAIVIAGPPRNVGGDG